MKNCSANFKQEITLLGKQQDLKISYGSNEELLKEDINSASIFYEGNILKSMMKSLEMECNTTIAIGTELDVRYGLLINDEYEYIDYGKFYVYKVEKQEDTGTYLIKCYDLMLNSMVNYDDVDLDINWTQGIMIGAYLMTLALAVGIQWDINSGVFANSTRIISSDIYKGLGYTVRDVFDEISAVAGGSLCINNSNKLEMRYPSATSQYTIDENYFKDINVNFGKKYGPINSIVLSRSAESDNVYIDDEDSIRENGLCELKIVDNQLMNFNDRADYLPELFQKLNGLNYFVNDYSSYGIAFLEYMDKYNVSIDNNLYNCLMLNDELNVTQGLEELVHTNMPEQTETDYTKADKTDRKINQTYLIVDKQNQKIESVITEVDEQNDKITQIEQTTDEIRQEVANMYNATKTVRANKTVVLPKCIKGYLLKLRILGNNTVFDRLYPVDDLYPSNTLYPRGDSRIIVTDKDGNSQMYELRVPSVLRANSEVYDEYILENNYAKIIRRVNADGTTKAHEEVEVIGTYTIYVAQDENTIEIMNYDGTLEATYVEQNAYTDQFATKIEMSSAITQTAEEINTEVRKKVGEDEVISKINQSAEAVTINANKISLDGKTIDLTGEDINITSNNFSVDSNGNMSCNNANVTGTITSNNATITGGSIVLNGTEGRQLIKVQKNNSSYTMTYIQPMMIGMNSNSAHVELWADDQNPGVDVFINSVGSYIRHDKITTPQVIQTSKESVKKNIEKYSENASDIVKNAEIYTYNFQFENNDDKKHIGFVIGDLGGDYKTPDEVMSKDKEGIEQYNMTSILWKAVQEQQELIEQMQKEIKELKEGK